MSFSGKTPKFESVEADNLKIDGNTLSSTDENGDISLTPNGTGRVRVPALTQGDNSNSAASTSYVDTAKSSAISTANTYTDDEISGLSLGEANTASNLGLSGEGLFSQKVGADLQFKKIKSGTNVTITSDSESVTISSAGGATNLTVNDFDPDSIINSSEDFSLQASDSRLATSFVLKQYIDSNTGSGSFTGFVLNSFSGTGLQTIFTLTQAPTTEDHTDIFVNGVYQQKATYTVVGTTLTFSEAPPTGTNNIEVKIFEVNAVASYAYAPSTPSNWSVAPDDVSEALDSLASGKAGTVSDVGVSAGGTSVIKSSSATGVQVKGIKAGNNISITDEVGSNNVVVSASYIASSVPLLNIDWSSSDLFYKDLSASSTLTFSNIVQGKTISVAIRNTSASDITITLPTVIKSSTFDATVKASNKETVFTFMAMNSKVYAASIGDMS